MSQDVDSTADHRARLVVVERGLDELKSTVGDLAKSINRYINEQNKAPRPIPFKEIVVTAVSTLALFSGILTFLDNRTADKIEIAHKRDAGAKAVIEYRLDQIEKKAFPSVTLVRPVQ